MKNITTKIAIVAVSLFAIATSNAYADQPYQAQSSVVSVPSSQAPITRAQVRSDLVKLEAAGFNPNTEDSDYPMSLQAAEQRVSAEQFAQTQAPTNTASTTLNSEGSNGGTISASGTSNSNACVGPVDFCTPFFGH